MSETRTRTGEARVAELVQILADTEAELAELTGGELDAVVDPRSAAPILLRAAQERLAASEERLRELLARCPVLVLELRRDGRITYANDAVARVLAVAAEQLEKTSWPDLLELDGAASAQSILEMMFDEGLTNYPIQLRSHDGREHWVEWTTAAGKPDETDRLLLFGLDVTQKRDLLSERVARAEAEAANKTKSEFMAKMSHELRTPLNAIGGYTELLEYGIAGSINERQLEYLKRIRVSQAHLLALIDDVISFARLEAGQLTVDYSKVSVAHLLEVCETLTTPLAARRGVGLEFEHFSGDNLLWADRDKVEQILVNLVTNAIKFTDAGGEIRVHAEALDGHIKISVTDTGCGIPAEKLELVFQPFVQVENGLTRTRDGVGLGLAISRDLARTMGGDLEVKSTVGRGSRFTLILPQATDRQGSRP